MVIDRDLQLDNVQRVRDIGNLNPKSNPPLMTQRSMLKRSCFRKIVGGSGDR